MKARAHHYVIVVHVNCISVSVHVQLVACTVPLLYLYLHKRYVRRERTPNSVCTLIYFTYVIEPQNVTCVWSSLFCVAGHQSSSCFQTRCACTCKSWLSDGKPRNKAELFRVRSNSKLPGLYRNGLGMGLLIWIVTVVIQCTVRHMSSLWSTEFKGT